MSSQYANFNALKIFSLFFTEYLFQRLTETVSRIQQQSILLKISLIVSLLVIIIKNPQLN